MEETGLSGGEEENSSLITRWVLSVWNNTKSSHSINQPFWEEDGWVGDFFIVFAHDTMTFCGKDPPNTE